MWFGHMNGMVSLFHDGTFLRLPVNIDDSGPVTCFAGDMDGSVWMSTYNGYIIKLDPVTGIADKKVFKTNDAVQTFQFVEKNRLLIGTASGLFICRMEASEKIVIDYEIPETHNKQIVRILKKYSGEGYYVASADDGIFILNNDLKISRIITSVTNIQSISEDPHQNLWVATFGRGLICFNGGKEESIDFSGYTSGNVKSVFTGNDGIIWSGGYGSGLTRITGRVFNISRFGNDIYGKNITAIFHEGTITWMGTEKGLVKLERNGKTEIYRGNIRGRITALCKDSEGVMWIGTESDGVFRLSDSGKPEKFDIGGGSLENSITSIICTDAFVWIGRKKGLCRVSVSDVGINWYTIRQGLPHNSINGLYSDISGKLWIGSRSNVLAFHFKDQVSRFPVFTGSSSVSFSHFAEDKDSLLWIGSLGNGIFRISSDSVISLTTQNGLYSDFCHSMIHDNRGNIWVIHKDGLSRIHSASLYVRTFDIFGLRDEKFNFNPGAASKDSEGKIWLGTTDGIVIIDQSGELQSIPPVPEILSFRVNNVERDFKAGRIVLKPGKYNFEIIFSAVNLKEPEMVIFKTQLKGYDLQAEQTNLNNSIYRNVTEGNYLFSLSASNGDGVTSGSVGIEILIRTPITKQWWFYLALAAFAGIMLTIYLKRREYIFQTEREQLEEKVLERTREIQEQKNEIEKQTDLIRTKNEEITASIRYALEIQNAVLPSFSTIDRYFPENFIFLRPKDIVSGDFYWIARKNDKLVFTVADCTGHGVPGAFMSLLRVTILNEIVNVEGITQTDKIANRLHAMIHKSLNRSRADGLDMAICVYDWNQKRIQYTGAMNHLVHMHNGEMNVYKADQYSINMVPEDFTSFSIYEFDICKGDVIYLFTDGYMDQFGGEKDKKFSVSRFYNALTQIHLRPMHDQETILEQKYMDWKKDKIQTDDITVMGIRF